MYDFTYHRATSLDDAQSVLTGAEDGKLLAGGMTLIPTLKQRLAQPSDVIDLGALNGLRTISDDGDAITIGAMATHASVANDSGVGSRIPALSSLASGIGDPQVRHRGTIGGSIANNDPAADYPAAVLGLGATVQTSKREVAADDFFTGLFETVLDEEEIITAVRFPVPARAAYMKFANPASRYAIVGVMVSQGPAGTRVAVTGAGPCVFRATAMEEALSSNFSADALAGLSHPAEGLSSDLHASADYRAHLVGVMAQRAVQAAGG